MGALMGFRAMRLSGELTPALKGEWEASCRRRAQHLLTHQCPRGCRLFLSVQNFSTGEGYGIIEVLGEAVQAAVGRGGDPALGEAAQAGESAWQAAVGMEDMIVSKFRVNDPVWSALLGWLTATGVLCHAHVMRSWPRRLSHSTFHGRCSGVRLLHPCCFRL